MNVCILSLNSRSFCPAPCFGPLLWASVVDRNFVQATTDEFAATAEIRNQIRKPLGGAGSGGIHNNNFKTNQSECLEFHDFHGVFWALCSIILSFFDLDSCRPMSLCRVLGGFPVKYSTFCAAKAMKLWQAYGVYSVFQKWRASFCKMSLHHFLKTGICGNFHQQSRRTEAWVSQSRVNPEHKHCNCIYNTVHSPRWCSAQKSGRTSGVLRLLSTLATQTMLWMHLGAGKTMAQFRRWKPLCPTSLFWSYKISEIVKT